MAVLEIKRRLVDGDMADVDELLRQVERADGQRPLSDHLWIDLREGGRPGFAGLLAWIPGHDHLVAYCQVSRGNDSWSLDVIVSPHHRYEMSTIGPELLAEALRIIAAEGGGRVHWWVFEPTAMHADLAHRVGLSGGRLAIQMRVPLPIAAPTPTIVTRPFRVGQDEDAWLRVNNRAFAAHPEQGAWTLDILRSRQQQPWFNPNGFLLHEIDGELAGFCWTKVHLDTQPVLGEIYVIAVDPDYAGRGLGRQLTVSGLRYLHQIGAPVGMLYVDSTNERAVSMYRSLGFVSHHQQRAFVGDVI
jgi:mycothiol synthase